MTETSLPAGDFRSDPWAAHAETLSIRKSFGAATAVDFIDSTGLDSSFSPIMVLKADCLVRIDRSETALELLERAYLLEPNNLWVIFGLNKACVSLGRHNEAIKWLWKAHELLGWHESGEKKYIITHDYFSLNIPKWLVYFSHLIGKPDIRVLEIGSWQGASTCWLLDRILTSPDARITCVDTFEGSSEHVGLSKQMPKKLEDIFDHNVRASGSGHKVEKIKGLSQEVTRQLVGEQFDLVYIDGAHEAKYVIQDALLCWPLIKRGGLLLFDDYHFEFHMHPDQNTARAIDFFTAVMQDELEIIDKSNQVLVRKIV